MKKVMIVLLFFASVAVYAQEKANYDESKVPEYKLPEVLVTVKGRKIKTTRKWIKKRRPELVALFEGKYVWADPRRIKYP